jgi:hypothetical protein
LAPCATSPNTGSYTMLIGSVVTLAAVTFSPGMPVCAEAIPPGLQRDGQ